jgi:metal-responsive CopG/Arc/MetJ family transcriptional regulator
LDNSYGIVSDVARKQVIVQLDDRLVHSLDREAKRRGVSRSELIRRAATAFLDALDEAEAERQMIEAYRRIPDDVDPAWDHAVMQIAAENWPE